MNEFVFDSDDFAGVWKISGVAGYDKVGNQNWIVTDELEAAGIETSIEVVGGSDDFEAPTFVDMSISPNFVDVSSGPQGVIFDVEFDDASGIEGFRYI